MERFSRKVGHESSERCSDRGLDVNSATCFAEYFLRSVRRPTRYRPVRAKLWIIAGRPFFKVGRADLARCINNQRPRDGRAGQLRGVPRATITMRTKRTKGGFQSVSCELLEGAALLFLRYIFWSLGSTIRPEIFQIRVSLPPPPNLVFSNFEDRHVIIRPR